MTIKWEKLGRILEPDTDIFWLYSSAGASCALPSSDGEGIIDIYVNGRDKQRRSRIGLVKFDLNTLSVIDISPEPVFDLGGKGAFDENGVSYPYVIKVNNRLFMYYAGWVQGVQVPWMNGLGLATSSGNGVFERYSRAPILPRDNEDYIGIGSCSVLEDQGRLKMWYSRYQKWGEGEDEHRHYYNIKYAESEDGVNWVRGNKICVDFRDSTEYAIAKPCVHKLMGKYVMWYSYRGSSYRVGFAISENGVDWVRRDELAGIEPSADGWDSQMVCYAYVFQYKDDFYMLHNGNGYGDSGLGLAKIEAAKILDVI
jgi:hypothetical protein